MLSDLENRRLWAISELREAVPSSRAEGPVGDRACSGGFVFGCRKGDIEGGSGEQFRRLVHSGTAVLVRIEWRKGSDGGVQKQVSTRERSKLRHGADESVGLGGVK